MNNSLCYFVQCHHDYPSVAQLLRQLDHPDDLTIVHADPRDQDFCTAVRLRVGVDTRHLPIWLSPEHSTYAAWPQVFQVLRAMKMALRWPVWTHFLNLCGASLPITTREQRLASLRPGRTYMITADQDCVFGQMTLDRVRSMWSYDSLAGTHRHQGFDAPWDVEQHLSRQMGLRVRVFGQCPAFSAFCRDDCELLVGDSCAPLRAWWNHVHCPDESFYATALRCLRPEGIIDRGIMECRWSAGNMAADVYHEEDVPGILAKRDQPNGPLFARKIPVGKAADLILSDIGGV